MPSVPSESVPALIDLMKNEIYAKGTSAAIQTLGRIGSQAETAAPYLVHIATGSEVLYRPRHHAVSKIKKSALWRLIFLREEFKRPWSFPRLDISNFPGTEVTIPILRRDAAISILQITSVPEYADVAVATLRELWSDPFAGVSDNWLLGKLNSETIDQVKSKI